MSTGDGFESYLTAGDFQHVLNKMIDSRVASERPASRGARVVSINHEERYCMVVFNGETTPVKIPYGGVAPATTGQIVRIEGLAGDRYIANVLGDSEAQVLASTASANATTAQAAADAAIGAAATAQETADGKVNTYFQSTAPTGMLPEDFGDLWFDTDDNNKMSRWDGANWILSDDQRIAAAVTAAHDAALAAGLAQDSADRKIVTFYQPEPAPSSANRTIGDLWFNESKQLELSRWNGSAWVSARDATIAAVSGAAASALQAAQDAQSTADQAKAIADGAIRTWYQETAPTGLNNTGDLGDLWYKESTGVASRWNGTDWIAIPDSSIASALAAAQNAQTTADGKIDSFYQPNSPTVCAVGDLWFNTADKMWPYYCSKASPNPTWTSVRDLTIKDARDTADAAAAAASAAQGTATDAATAVALKPGTYRSPGPPTGTRVVGDLWYDSDDNETLRRWGPPDGGGANDWILVHKPITGTNGTQLALPDLSSAGFTEGSQTGWIIRKDGTAEFGSILTRGQATGPSAGYTEVSARGKFQYKGEELTDILMRMPQGILAHASVTENSAAAANNNVLTYKMKCPVPAKRTDNSANRRYRVTIKGCMYKNGPGTVKLGFALSFGRDCTVLDSLPGVELPLSYGNYGPYFEVNMSYDFSIVATNVQQWISLGAVIRAPDCGAQFTTTFGYGTGPSFTMTIEDLGLWVDMNLNDARVPQTMELPATSGAQYDGAGNSYPDSSYWAGQGFDFVGVRQSYFLYDKAQLNRLTGIQSGYIDSLQIYMNILAATQGKSFEIGYTTATSLGGTEPGGTYNSLVIPNIYPGQAQWIDIPVGNPIMGALYNGTLTGLVVGSTGSAFNAFCRFTAPVIRTTFRN